MIYRRWKIFSRGILTIASINIYRYSAVKYVRFFRFSIDCSAVYLTYLKRLFHGFYNKKEAGKCVILFGPNAGSAPGMVHTHAMEILLNKGAKIVTVDYRGYGHSRLPAASLKISQNTLYSDGETIYKYVLEKLNYRSQDVIVFGFSLGGSVASHVAEYASSKNQALGGLILASPINNLYSAAADMTCKPLGAVARVVTMSALNTEDNLSRVDRNIPLFLCSGDYRDFLSLEKTLLHEKIRELGFKNVKTHIEKCCDHNNLNFMFQKYLMGISGARSDFDTYVSMLENPVTQ